MPHIIRLRGRWCYQPLWQWEQAADGTRRVSSDDPPTGGAFTAPGNWKTLLGDDFRGCVRLVRVFHRPTGLDANSRVWLAFCEMPAVTQLVLNGCPIGEEARSGRCDILSQLAASNELAITITLDGQDPAHLLGQVQLEIE